MVFNSNDVKSLHLWYHTILKLDIINHCFSATGRSSKVWLLAHQWDQYVVQPKMMVAFVTDCSNEVPFLYTHKNKGKCGNCSLNNMEALSLYMPSQRSFKFEWTSFRNTPPKRSQVGCLPQSYTSTSGLARANVWWSKTWWRTCVTERVPTGEPVNLCRATKPNSWSFTTQ